MGPDGVRVSVGTVGVMGVKERSRRKGIKREIRIRLMDREKEAMNK